MTPEQIKSIRFSMTSHMSMATRHISVYKAVDVPFSLLMQVSVPTCTEEGRRGRTTKRFFLNGKWYTRKQLYKELEKL